MTVANTTRRISAVGNAAIGQEVPFSFPYAAKSDIKVYSRVIATGVPTDLAEITNYTLTAPSDTGGTLTTVTAVAVTSEIHIIRDTPRTQSLDLEQGGSFSAEDVEDALDKNTKLIIENKDSLDRALRAPVTDAVALDLELPNSVDRASKNLGFDASGNVTVTDSSGTFITQTAVWDDIITKSPRRDVRAYGADTSNADNATEIQAAIDASETIGRGVVEFPPGTFSADSGITVNLTLTKLVGLNTKLDFTGMVTSDKAITLTGSASGSPYHQATGGIEGFIMQGPGTGGTSKGLYFHTAAESGTSHTSVSKCGIYEFNTGISFGDNAYLQYFNNVDVFSCVTGVHVPDSLTNSASMLNFIDCVIFANTTRGMYLQNSNATIYLTQTAIDNNTGTQIEITQGQLFLVNSQIECGAYRALYVPAANPSAAFINVVNSYLLQAASSGATPFIDMAGHSYLSITNGIVSGHASTDPLIKIAANQRYSIFGTHCIYAGANLHSIDPTAKYVMYLPDVGIFKCTNLEIEGRVTSKVGEFYNNVKSVTLTAQDTWYDIPLIAGTTSGLYIFRDYTDGGVMAYIAEAGVVYPIHIGADADGATVPTIGITGLEMQTTGTKMQLQRTTGGATPRIIAYSVLMTGT